MDPMNREPEDYGHGHNNDRLEKGDRDDGTQRPPRDAITPELGQKAPAPARTVQLVSGDLLLTVNPVDGSEIEPCPPGEQPSPTPVRHSAEEREELRRAAHPPVPAGPAAPPLPLLERDEQRDRLVRLLGHGRSVRLTGPAGSGRTTLLDAVAADCAGLAPDGVVRLSGYHRTPTELLYELFAAVHSAPLHRPGRTRLLELVRDIGAVVVVDDLDFGGSALDELLDATPECAFLLAATPDVAAPSSDSPLEEVFLQGLGRGAALELLERAVGRPLTDDEANWAGDLWFESEGRPLRFVQAGALLRQRDALRTPEPDPDDDEDNVFADGHDAPLPTLGEGAAPAALLASRLSESARDTLRFALALGGEVPHQAHLPALVGDTHADAALGELTSCGLLTPVGSRYRLAAGVVAQLENAGYGEGAVERAHTAAQHYAWWTNHPSVGPDRAVAEADAVLASMTALVPGDGETHTGAAVLLARSAAPAFASGLHWGAWERALRSGQEAARIAGEVAEEAYFHHELGVLALCTGNLDRARAELEASIAMRGALADKRGTVSGRRALALVADREGATPPGSAGGTPAHAGGHGGLAAGGRSPAGEEVPAARHEESASPPGGVPAVVPLRETLVTRRETQAPAGAGVRRSTLVGTRRNVVAAGAGALLAAVLGTVVTLGATSGNDEPVNRVTNEQSANEDDGGDGLNADVPADDSTGSPDDTKASEPAEPGPSREADPGESGSAGSPSTTGGGTSTSGGGTGSSGSTTGGRPSTTGGSSSSTGGSPKPSSSPTSGGSGTPTGSPSPSTGGSSTPTSPSPTSGGPTSSGATTTGSGSGGAAAAGGTSEGSGGGTTSGAPSVSSASG
ncbi:ATP-binding protein [Streptomyces sp. NPDC057445]|uniref:ATP-binding protein n=1 Tax=Streptomyces sp. NPDC057445 TaxID=3346136 RepID=UPI00368C9FAF